MTTFRPPEFRVVVEKSLSGIRIDSFLAKHFRNYHSWRMQRIVKAGGVRINAAIAEQTDRVFQGQIVTVRLIEPPDKLLEPEPMDLSILFQDAWLMVVNKPVDLVVHPVGPVQTGTLANGLQAILDQQTECKGILRPGIVHRLDRQTSGAMVIALVHNAHSTLSSAFESSRVAKTYIALVEGIIPEDAGTIDQAIGRAPTGRHVLMSCRADARKRKPSKTVYQVLKRFRHHTLVLARPLTGRNHQIRVHFAHCGHPLVGDEFYERHGQFKPFYDSRTKPQSREVETGLPIRRHALHAYSLEFSHPITNVWMKFSAPLPDDFAETLSHLQRYE